MFEVTNDEFGYTSLPAVGSQLTIHKVGESDINLELVAYTVDLNKMSVSYEAGMKTKNIGDVIYNVNSNMSTNIN